MCEPPSRRARTAASPPGLRGRRGDQHWVIRPASTMSAKAPSEKSRLISDKLEVDIFEVDFRRAWILWRADAAVSGSCSEYPPPLGDIHGASTSRRLLVTHRLALETKSLHEGHRTIPPASEANFGTVLNRSRIEAPCCILLAMRSPDPITARRSPRAPQPHRPRRPLPSRPHRIPQVERPDP